MNVMEGEVAAPFYISFNHVLPPALKVLEKRRKKSP